MTQELTRLEWWQIGLIVLWRVIPAIGAISFFIFDQLGIDSGWLIGLKVASLLYVLLFLCIGALKDVSEEDVITKEYQRMEEGKSITPTIYEKDFYERWWVTSMWTVHKIFGNNSTKRFIPHVSKCAKNTMHDLDNFKILEETLTKNNEGIIFQESVYKSFKEKYDLIVIHFPKRKHHVGHFVEQAKKSHYDQFFDIWHDSIYRNFKKLIIIGEKLTVLANSSSLLVSPMILFDDDWHVEVLKHILRGVEYKHMDEFGYSWDLGKYSLILIRCSSRISLGEFVNKYNELSSDPNNIIIAINYTERYCDTVEYYHHVLCAIEKDKGNLNRLHDLYDKRVDIVHTVERKLGRDLDSKGKAPE